MASNSYKLEIDSLQQVIKIQDYSVDSKISEEEVRKFPSKFYVSKNRFRKVRFVFPRAVWEYVVQQ